VAAVALRVLVPDYFSPSRPRPLRAAGPPEDEDPAVIPDEDLPGGKLVTRFDQLRSLGLFDRDLAPKQPLWSSSFFPWWFGGEAGRWQDGELRLALRTLTGFSPPTEAEARGWLEAAGKGDPAAQRRLFDLAPTEKLDLAYGELSFPRTRATLQRTHNGWPRYWYGRCNGIASAALHEPEPYRVVELIGNQGQRVRFHPQDVKALLAVAYYAVKETYPLGGRCGEVSLDSGATCSMNPAGLVLAVLNRIGLAGQSFLMDALPTPANQYYAVAGARVSLLGEPRPLGDEDLEPALVGRAAQLVDVRVDLALSSTTLAYSAADVPDPADPTRNRYQRVGLRAERMSYPATLVLSKEGDLIGGRWTGVPGNGPDDVVFVRGGPYLPGDGGALPEPEVLAWPIIRELAHASASEGEGPAVLDLRTSCDGGCPP
jgi:hypothetical protein